LRCTHDAGTLGPWRESSPRGWAARGRSCPSRAIAGRTATSTTRAADCRRVCCREEENKPRGTINSCMVGSGDRWLSSRPIHHLPVCADPGRDGSSPAAPRLSRGCETQLQPHAGWGGGGSPSAAAHRSDPRRGCPCAAAFPPHPCLHSPPIAGGDNDKPTSTLPARELFVQIKVAPGKQAHPARGKRTSALPVALGQEDPRRGSGLGRAAVPSVPDPRAGTCWASSAPRLAPLGRDAWLKLLRREFGRGRDVPVGWHGVGTRLAPVSHTDHGSARTRGKLCPGARGRRGSPAPRAGGLWLLGGGKARQK